MNGKKAFRGEGFTLVELLVVLAILAIACSLLFPALTSAKAKGRTTQCRNNLRQHGIALQSFVQQNSVYPLQNNPLKNRNSGLYPAHAATWMNSLFPDHMEGFDGYENSGVFDCPSARRPKTFPTNRSFSDYGYNSNGLIGRPFDESLGLGGKGSAEDIFAPPVKESEVVNPAQMLAIGDGLKGWNDVIADGFAVSSRTPAAKEIAGSSERAKKRHGGNALFVFCDGHVEQLSLKKLFAATNADALKLWNRDGQGHADRIQE